MKTQTSLTEKMRGGAFADTGHFARILRLLSAAALVAGASGVLAGENAEARFRGTGKADPIRITNVRRSDGPAAGQSCVALDLAWDHSWRAAWDVSKDQHGGADTLKLESWDAAWVFVKFRKPGDEAYSHATLSTRTADHSVPGGAKLEVGPSDDGKRGLGVFVYRAATGSGANDFKGVTLCWLHKADGVEDLGAVDLKVFGVSMVYVPKCAFWAGDGSTSDVAGQFSAGDTTDPFRIESEDAITLGGTSKENLGNRDGIGMMDVGEDFTSRVTRTLPAEFPKGCAAFYCMRYELTEGEYVAFLNTLSFEQQARLTGNSTRALGKPDAPAGSPIPTGSWEEGRPFLDRNVIKIAVPGISGAGGKTAKPAVYKADARHVACPFLLWTECLAYAGWAGLRPMTELEYEKACRGPLKPVPDEFAWGTNRVVGTIRPGSCHDARRIVEGTGMDDAADGYAIQNASQPDERVVYTGGNGPDATRGNAAWWGAVPLRIGQRAFGGGKAPVAVMGPLRVGIFATPDSGRVAAGASYWGIMELTGNLSERVVTVGHPAARRFMGTHGSGSAITLWKKDPGVPSDQPEGWHFSDGHEFAVRGGANGSWYDYNGTLRTSDRWNVQTGGGAGSIIRLLQFLYGFRCVRTAH